MTSDDYNELEKQLAENALTKRELPSPEMMAARVAKHIQSKELVRLGVYGVMGVALSLFVPLLMRRKPSRHSKSRG
ncbi:MAG: hypothetical protein ACJA13_001732 [Paraglaciecola sp.]|jgi:hypothetical protein